MRKQEKSDVKAGPNCHLKSFDESVFLKEDQLTPLLPLLHASAGQHQPVGWAEQHISLV